MTEDEKKAIPVVPKHFVAKVKPHASFKAQVAQKKAI